MPGLILAPYNDSMRLGQGFNSFLQVPCIDNAVSFDPTKVVVDRAQTGPGGVSQVVSYSSRFVEKISDVVRSMNISAGSSIKSGSIEIGGNSLSVDEAKFASSDLNAVISVKVINQTTKLVDAATFQPIDEIRVDNDKFFDIYGDCYISGFIEGGDLHGIVSIKVLDASSKYNVERAIKGQMNGSGGASEFTLSEGLGKSSSGAALSQTETTITVNWSGGGQIKPDTEEWSLDNVFKAAAGFPARVALCPQRTWAILTKYDNNRDFVQWAERNRVSIPQYQGVQAYTSDLLDMFMEYKNNIARLQDVLTNPLGYVMSHVSNAITISVASIVEERKKMKKEMRTIVKVIDKICLEPHNIEDIEEKYKIESPEVWATRLPISKHVAEESGGLTSDQAQKELAAFSFVATKAPTIHSDSTSGSTSGVTPESTLDSALKSSMGSIQSSTVETAEAISPPETVAPEFPPLCTPEIEATFSNWEKSTITSPDARRDYQKYRFSRPCGLVGGGPFNDVVQLNGAMVPVSWPKRVEVNMVRWGNKPIVGWYTMNYDQMALSHGNDRGTAVETLALNLADGEYVNKVRMCKGDLVWGLEGIVFMEVTTSMGRVERCGSESDDVVEAVGPSGFPGLKGFFGCSGDVVDRMGAIWGKQ